ncbi:MAG: hypothetical protein WAT79_02465 [Saprospiraceae bacterium]
MSIKKSLVTGKGIYKVTFSLPVKATEGTSSVVLLGDFNQWDPSKAYQMKAGKTEFAASIDLKPGTYEFRYLIDGNIWENDYSADNYIASPFPGINNSVLHLPAVEKKSAVKTGVVGKKAVVKANKPSAAKAVKSVTKATLVEAKPATKVVKAVAKPAVKATTVKSETKAPTSVKKNVTKTSKPIKK